MLSSQMRFEDTPDNRTACHPWSRHRTRSQEQQFKTDKNPRQRDRRSPVDTHKNNRPAVARRNVRKWCLVRSLVKSFYTPQSIFSQCRHRQMHSRVLVSNSMIAIGVTKEISKKKLLNKSVWSDVKHPKHAVSSSSFGYASQVCRCRLR